MLLGTVVAMGATAPGTMAQTDESADTAFDGFRTALVADLVETRSRLATAGRWVDDPDWYLVQTPDSGVVGVRRSELALHAALLADPAFAARVDLLDDPVHAWDDSFTMSLGLIRDEGGDPIVAAERSAVSLSQTAAQKKALLRLERQALRADRDRLISAIDAFDAIARGMGIQPPALAADDTEAVLTDPAPVEPAPARPLELVLAFRDGLAVDREAVQARMSDCRAAIDEEDIVAFGERDGLPGVVVFDLTTLPDFADFASHLRDRGELWDDWGPWDAWYTIVESDTAQLQPLRAAMLLFSRWQDWTPEMRAAAEQMWPRQRQTAKEDRAICRPQLQLLRPEQERLDAAIAALDEYLALAARDTGPMPSEMPNPFADL